MTDDATRRQIRAADPRASTWLSANAGSGKTRVLTDRVARLLLSGTDPRNILCLTYTKAAAGEMQNRLFRRLGQWAMLGDADLRAALADLGETGPGDLARARTLFARAIEVPGGLKIQTIHSFCAALLRQFPLEAGVAPGFAEMDESAQGHLIAEVVEALAEADPDGAVSGFVQHYTGEDLGAVAAEIARARAAFADPPDRAALCRHYGIAPEVDADAVLATVGADPALLRRLRSVLADGSSTELTACGRLAGLGDGDVGYADLPMLETVFLTGKDAKEPFASKAGKFPTKATRGELGRDVAELDALMDRVAAARPQRIALDAVARSRALHGFAAAFLPAYAAAKTARGWVDFDDLIDRAGALLADTAAADWVRFRLDGRIDHVLVDESQDTSPAQWRLIEHLTTEFGAGEGTRAAQRTLFVVGDKKQSIYSFQGADAEGFERYRNRFRQRMSPAGGMQALELRHSFRSAPAILATVDATFEGAAGLGGEVGHLAFRAAMPGRVDLWPLVPKPEVEEDGDWSDPVDRLAANNPSTILAERIAGEIRRMVDDPARLLFDGNGGIRRITEGDVLILVQGRSGVGNLFDAIIRALKTADLAVAGADLLRLGAELAVRDLTALLSFLALPEDSLSLAAALRSPLFGWSEDALYRLAAGRRERHLWQALRTRAAEHPDTVAMLQALRRDADFLRPYDLIERVLIRHDGRRRLLARLGPEAEDGVDELLSLALSYESQEIPSLTGFLAWLGTEDATVKRPLDMAGGKIRVMTAHGAKGLEAPIVILPDTLRRERPARDAIVTDADGRAHWRAPAAARPAALAEMADAEAERQRLERQRLLYVAMTRAESWLIVAGAGDAPDDCWYRDVEAGLRRMNAAEIGFPFGPGLRLETGDWDGGKRAGPAYETRRTPEPLPGWTARPAPAAAPAPGPLAPSDLGGAKALPGEAGADEDTALRTGRQMHLLLEHLAGVPAETRGGLAVDLLTAGEDPAPAEEAHRLATDAGAVLDDPDLAEVFGPAALAEVEIAAALPELGHRRILGAIDRLVLTPDRVLAVDFKTNAVVPDTPGDVPEGLLRQMGAYGAALAQIHPDRRVELAILWTRTATLMPLPHEMVMAALRRAAIS